VAESTNLISGLISGFDWRTMVDELIAIDRQRVTLVENSKSVLENKLTEWRSFNTKLLAFKTAADALKTPEAFTAFTSRMTSSDPSVATSSLLSATVSSSAAPGTYAVTVLQTAESQKLSSGAFTSATEALGADFAGDLLVNGTVITIDAADSLGDLRDRINQGDAGVTASIINYREGDYRLTLTSAETGAEGIGLANGGTNDLLNRLGFADSTRTAKHHTAGGDKSDTFTSAALSIGDLLGLTGAASGTVQVNGTAVEIDLSEDSLDAIAVKMTAAGVAASVVSEEDGEETTYRLFIAGVSNTYTDGENILETLGVVRGGLSDVMGVEGDVENTSGAASVTADTLIQDLDGYGGYEAGDYFHMAGTDTDGVEVSLAPEDRLVIGEATTVGDLLAKIEAVYGDVTASITGDGRLRVVDNGSGESLLSMELSVKNGDGSAEDTLRFATDGDLGAADTLRKRELVAGADSALEIDGVTVTSSTNTVDDVIEGVSLSLLQADPETAVTLTVTRDTSAVTGKITTFVNSYNAVMTYINDQQAYDTESGTTGGLLFGDGTLSSVKSDLTSTLLQTVWGVNDDFSFLSLAGITLNDEGLLNVNMSLLGGYLNTNFNDIMALFSLQGAAEGADLEYIAAGSGTLAGAYTVRIDQAAARAVAAGTTDLSGTLDGDVTLAVTESGYRGVVELTAGMTLSEIVEAVNTELGTARAEIRVGSVALYEGAGQAVALTAETAWDQVYVGGDSASLESGDTIAFSGTDPSGRSVSGVYEIGNAGTDTVQGLLTAIESAYGGTVSASIDDSGRISVTDTTAGRSRLSISFDCIEAHQLTFGTVDVSEDGADGSRQGRYALSVTASDDGGGHLVLTGGRYGNAGSFTVTQTGGSDVREIQTSGRELATAASSGAILAGETTTWDALFGMTVADGDTLTISGTTHGGEEVGPVSYALYDGGAARDMASLLDAIETAFGGSESVEARIADGKIVVESLVSGEGSLSVSLTANNEGEGSDLDPGTFEATVRNLSLGLVSETARGLDVVGSINGEDASGSGQTLTGLSGAANTAGLAVKYTGDEPAEDAGTVTVTAGMAELFSRALTAITSSSGGYVTYKQESLQSSIDRYETQIEQMDAYLERKTETMINRYVAMELALEKLQSQSDWLTGQLGTVMTSWY